MKKWLSVLLIAFALTACEEEHGLDNEYFVFTDYDSQTDFTTFDTYFIPDSILLIGSSKEPVYLKGKEAERIVNAYVGNMDQKGYRRTDKKEEADLGIQVSYIQNTQHFVGYTQNPYWWWGYPSYWSPFYWGDWGYWGYSYPVQYSYSVGSLLTEMINLTAPEGKKEKLPVVWNAYISGLLTGYKDFDTRLTIKGIDQALRQSEYIHK